MNSVLALWNRTDVATALEAMIDCCAAHRWAAAMVDRRPMQSEHDLHETADRLWSTMTESDWMEAFARHPRIGECNASLSSHRSSTWSGQEQSSIQIATDSVLASLASENARYETAFGFTYIVCATGKSPDEMLAILQRRLGNSHEIELREAAEQQREIMHIRLRKWLTS